MDQSNYLNRLRLLFDKKLEQEPKELKNSIEQIMSKAISDAVAKTLDYSKFNKKFYDLDKRFIESGNFVQHQILRQHVFFNSIYWDEKNDKVHFDIDLFQEEINLPEIISGKLTKEFYLEFDAQNWNNFFKSFKTKEEFEDFEDFTSSIVIDFNPYSFDLFLNTETLEFEYEPIPANTISLGTEITISNESKKINMMKGEQVLNFGIKAQFLMVYSNKLKIDSYVQSLLDRLPEVFENSLTREEHDFQTIQENFEKLLDPKSKTISGFDPVILLSGIIFSGYKPPFLMDESDLDNLKDLFRYNDPDVIFQFIILFSKVSKKTIFK
jgi:hypothetical protein